MAVQREQYEAKAANCFHIDTKRTGHRENNILSSNKKRTLASLEDNQKIKNDTALLVIE